MDFVAIDFETATSKWTSICSMGICVVENNIVKEVKEILVKPEPFEFNEYNIAIHGITPKDVLYRKTFDKYWNEIKPYLQNKLVIAHNASFDVGVLTKTLDMFGITLPDFEYLCTVKLSQKAYPELESHKLNALGDSLGIFFSHHTACDDAYACAMVLLHILEAFGIDSKEQLVDKFEIGLGRVFPGCIEPCRKNGNKKLKMVIQQIGRTQYKTEISWSSLDSEKWWEINRWFERHGYVFYMKYFSHTMGRIVVQRFYRGNIKAGTPSTRQKSVDGFLVPQKYHGVGFSIIDMGEDDVTILKSF